MKPDDKFPEEMLEDIRKAAIKAAHALGSLDVAIQEMREFFPAFRSPLMYDWWCYVVNASEDVSDIANVAEEIADAEDETPEGGEK